MNKITALLMVCVAAMVAAVPGVAWAVTRNVPGTYSTIQAAIDAANSTGDTIQVAAGTYAEAIVVNKALVIQGAGRDTTIIDATGAVADIAVNISNPGGDVTFDGFTVKAKGEYYPDDTFAMNVVSTTTASTITVTNNKFEGTGDPDNYEYGVYVHGTSAAFVFQHNIVTKGGGNPILIEKNPGATDVSYNTLDAGSWGMSCYYMTYGSVDVTTLQKFSNNTFDLGTGAAYDDDHHVEALSITGAYRRPLEDYGPGGYSHIEIKNNHIYNGHAYGRGIGLYNYSGGDGSDGLISNVMIEGNVIEGLSPANDGTHGLRLAGRLENITVKCNIISGMKDGCLGLVGYYGSHYPIAELSGNSLVGNALAVNWPSAATQLDAQDNWWGDASGPGPVGSGSGDRVSTNVHYDPWLATRPDCPSNLLYLEPKPASLYVQPGETVVVNLNVANLQKMVDGCQALIGYSSTYLTTPHSVAPGGPPWTELIYESWAVPGELDTAIGVNLTTPAGTDADGKVAIITMTAGTTDGTTQMVFRTDGENGYATMLSDLSHQPVWPSKQNSANIVIDGTDPSVDSFSAAPLCTKTTTTLTFTVSDNLAGVAYVDVYVAGGLVTHGVTSPYVLDMSALPTGCYDVALKVVDKAGNQTVSSPVSVCVDKTVPTIGTITAAEPQGSPPAPVNVLNCANPTLQGTVTITVAASDADCGGLQVPTVVLTNGSDTAELTTTDTASPFDYDWVVGPSTANGTWTITVTAKDGLDNTTVNGSNTLCVDKNQITGQVQLENFVGSSRVVTFVATGGTPKTWNLTLTGWALNKTSYTLTEVPAGTTGLSAKTAWNLRQKLTMGLDGDGQATGVNFTDADKLLGGDLNGDNFVNILDYSVLKANWNTTNAVADIDGSGQVQIDDYSRLKTNFFKRGDAQ